MRRRPLQTQPRGMPDELYRFEFARWRDPALDDGYEPWGAMQWIFAHYDWVGARAEWARVCGLEHNDLPESPDSDPIPDYPRAKRPPLGN